MDPWLRRRAEHFLPPGTKLDTGMSAEEIAERSRQLQETLRAAMERTYEGADESGAVSVAVNGQGRVVDVQITSWGAQRYDARTLEDCVVAAYRAATETMAAEVGALFGGGPSAPDPRPMEDRIRDAQQQLTEIARKLEAR